MIVPYANEERLLDDNSMPDISVDQVSQLTPKVSSPSTVVMLLLLAFGPSDKPPGRLMAEEGSKVSGEETASASDMARGVAV